MTVPLVNHELVINFSEDYSLTKLKDKEFTLKNPRAWINGLQSSACSSKSSGKHEMIGVLFTTTGLSSFTKIPLREFANKFIEPNMVFGKSFVSLVERLYETPKVKGKIDLVEGFFLERLHDSSYPRYLEESLFQLSNSFGDKGGVKRICEDMSITNKSLISAFNKYVGLSPIKYTHLQIVNKAISEIVSNPDQLLTSLTYDLNFFDQPHFNRLFKSYTSLTPTQYSSLVSNDQVETATPNFITTQG